MNDARAIAAQLVDIRNVGTHKVVKLTIHAPEEQAMQIMELFGWPTGVNPVPVALARLNPNKEVMLPEQSNDNPPETQPRPVTDRQASPAGADKRSFADMPVPQQAGMLSQDRAFRLFLAEQFEMPIPDPDEAASVIRHHCGVKSRAHLTNDNAKWSELVLAFRLWQRHPELSPA